MPHYLLTMRFEETEERAKEMERSIRMDYLRQCPGNFGTDMVEVPPSFKTIEHDEFDSREKPEMFELLQFDRVAIKVLEEESIYSEMTPTCHHDDAPHKIYGLATFAEQTWWLLECNVCGRRWRRLFQW